MSRGRPKNPNNANNVRVSEDNDDRGMIHDKTDKAGRALRRNYVSYFALAVKNKRHRCKLIALHYCSLHSLLVAVRVQYMRAMYISDRKLN